MRKYLLIYAFVFSCIFIPIQTKLLVAEGEPSLTELRSSYENLNVSLVQSMPNISIRSKKAWGFYGHSTIRHEYETKLIGDDKIVIDHASGLMWHPSGSCEYMKRKEVKKWIRGFNRNGYAGYYDWRVPTVEEAVSLLEANEKNSGLFIDTVFDKKQRWIWTGDSCSSGGMWRVYFDDGYVDWGDISLLFVRPVRKIK
jgi:hypothetical protein